MKSAILVSHDSESVHKSQKSFHTATFNTSNKLWWRKYWSKVELYQLYWSTLKYHLFKDCFSSSNCLGYFSSSRTFGYFLQHLRKPARLLEYWIDYNINQNTTKL